MLASTTRYAQRVGRDIREYAEWERTLATFVARKGTMHGAAPRTRTRTGTLSIRTGMQAASYMQSKQGSKDLQFHKEDWRLRNPKLGFMPIPMGMPKRELRMQGPNRPLSPYVILSDCIILVPLTYLYL